MARSGEHYPSPQAIWLHERVPGPLLIISVIGLPVVLYIMLGGLYVGRYDLSAIAFMCGCLPWLFLYMNGTGLKLAWDEWRVYMRPQGFRPPSWRRPWLVRLPWRSLAYDEIASLDALTVNDPAAKSFLLPFQLLRLTAKGTTEEYDERHIWLYSLALRDKEVAPLLRHLDARCPGMLPNIVRDRLAKWPDNDR
jgi:hypothetical protein